MKHTRSVLILLSINSFSSAYNPRVLDYALQVIEYLAGGRYGIFECIFFDVSPQYPFENIMSDVLESPQLQYLAKYVVHGSFRPDSLPKKPLLLVLNPGGADLSIRGTQMIIYKFLKLFHPATKVLVFIDIYDEENLAYQQWILLQAKCYKMLFLDPNRYELLMGSSKHLTGHKGPIFPHPRHIFVWYQKKLRGNNITYTSLWNWANHPAFQWFNATVEYLGGNALKSQAKGDDDYDIDLRRTIAKNTSDDNFRRIFLNEPKVGSILVPRGRQLNALEIMLLPFEWRVWILLAVIFVSVEIAKRTFPDHFRNDPTLLAICGFERSNLHQAGRLEKVVLLSLIVLVFFMTNAYETKIISFIVDNPSAESAKSLEDFDKFGLTFRYDLDQESYAVNHPVIGKYVVHDADFKTFDSTEPGVALYVDQEVVKLLSSLSYDFERGKTWFVELDQTFMIYSVQIFYTGIRSQYLETFRFTRVALQEAGLIGWWQWQYGQFVVRDKWGTKPRGAEDAKTYLFFDDMLMAWIVFVFGCGVSTVAFVGELAKMRIEMWISRFERYFRVYTSSKCK